ncbi:precorrin-4 C(11)-methyltransferase, partial [Streptomyces sp. SPB074]
MPRRRRRPRLPARGADPARHARHDRRRDQGRGDHPHRRHHGRPHPGRLLVPRQPPLLGGARAPPMLNEGHAPNAPHVLILGGTTEARRLAEALDGSPWRVTTSLAGRVTAPRALPGAVRVGGFGGTEGLAAWLRTHRVTALVDATHPLRRHDELPRRRGRHRRRSPAPRPAPPRLDPRARRRLARRRLARRGRGAPARARHPRLPHHRPHGARRLHRA